MTKASDRVTKALFKYGDDPSEINGKKLEKYSKEMEATEALYTANVKKNS